MLGLFSILFGLILGSLANVDERPPLQVGLALRSDAIVLVQLGEEKAINYTICKDVDQEYADFMAMMRRDQTNLSFLHEYDLHLQEYDAFHLKHRPIYNRTITQPVYPITNFHYAHVLARNIRPLVKQAEIELGSAIKCDIVMIPHYGNDYSFRHDCRPMVRFASELAGCGSIGYGQIPGLHRAVLWAHDLDMTDGLQREPGPYRHIDRICLLIEIERSHVRLSVINVMAKYVRPLCAYSCDRNGSSITETLSECAAKFKEDCLSYDTQILSRARIRRATHQAMKKVFVSGSIESQQGSIEMIIATQFGSDILDDMSFGVDPEILGAYGAAFLARISVKGDELRDLDTWNEPMFFDDY